VKLVSYRVFVKRIGLVGATNILVVITSIILTPLLTKTLSVSDYGVWIEVNTTYLLITGFNSLGLSGALIRFTAAEKDKKVIQEIFYSFVTLILITSLITSLILFYLSKSISIILFNGNVEVVMLTSSIIFIGSLNLFLIDYFRASGRMKIYSALLLIQAYFSLALISYFLLSSKGLITIVTALLITQLLITVIAIPIIVQNIGFKIPKFNNIIEYLKFGIPTIPNSIAYWVVDSSDRYFIAILLGTAFVGFYSPGYILGTLIFIFFTPLSLVLPMSLPTYYDSGKLEEVHRIIKYSLKYFLLVAIPSVFILSILSKQILLLLTTPEIASQGYLITPFIALCTLITCIFGIITQYLVLNKKTKIIGSIWIIAAGITFLNIVFIPYFGILGAATVTLISYTSTFLLGLYYTRKYFKIEFDYIFLLKSMLASVLMSIFIILANPQGLISLITVFIASVIIYLIIILLFKGINKNEINFLKSIVG
jgi:Membrane protein involved in the export of O-antigen and teichoic acid